MPLVHEGIILLCGNYAINCFWIVLKSVLQNKESNQSAKLHFRVHLSVDPCIIVQFIKKNPTRCNKVLKFYYFIFIWSSTCFGRHTAHHQEPKTALTAPGFAYVEGCWKCGCWTLSGRAWQRPATTRPTTLHVCKTRGFQCSFWLLMMGGVSPDRASYKYEIIKF
jgi:hypothetical protein